MLCQMAFEIGSQALVEKKIYEKQNSRFIFPKLDTFFCFKQSKLYRNATLAKSVPKMHTI